MKLKDQLDKERREELGILTEEESEAEDSRKNFNSENWESIK